LTRAGVECWPIMTKPVPGNPAKAEILGGKFMKSKLQSKCIYKLKSLNKDLRDIKETKSLSKNKYFVEGDRDERIQAIELEINKYKAILEHIIKQEKIIQKKLVDMNRSNIKKNNEKISKVHKISKFRKVKTKFVQGGSPGLGKG